MNKPFDVIATLAPGIDSIVVPDVAGLDVHCLCAGQPTNPLVLLLHGFPELSFSWRKIIPALATVGFYVVAPDLRGYGQTRPSAFRGTDRGWVVSFDDNYASASLCRMAGDIRCLVSALGFDQVHAVIGHDFGSPVAGVCALLRPDVFQSVVMMSAPFSGPPEVSVREKSRATGTDQQGTSRSKYSPSDLPAELAALDNPRIHYQWYYSGQDANDNMWLAGEGLNAFFRNYYHHKSADWPGNSIYPLESVTASELAKLPTYYVMQAGVGMFETVAEHAPDQQTVASCAWLTEAELDFYVNEYGRTGFQGGLQCYRCNTSGLNAAELSLFSGKTIDVPSLFVAGDSDWGVYQFPGDIEALENRFTTDFRGKHLIAGAGHWVQQEQPEAVLDVVKPFLLLDR